jgi:hypothetical protein
MSSERRFEHIENKIKEAAENNHIVFEENSWAKMEALLNKEDKKKPFFWLWFLVPIALVSAYGLFMFSKNNDKLIAKNNSENKIKKNNTSTKATIQKPSSEQQINIEDDAATTNNEINHTTKVASIVSSQNKSTYNTFKKTNPATTSFSKRAKYFSTHENGKAVKDYLPRNETQIKQQSKTEVTIQNANASEDEPMFTKTNNAKNIDVAIQKKNADTVTEIKKNADISITKNSQSKKEKGKSSKILSRFYLLGAAGVDIGSVKLFSFGNSSFSTKYGGSIGYNISKKISVQAGFYANKKKYIAGPTDYNVKAGSYWSIVPLTKVEAACLIYELPITLQYQFLQKKSFAIYAGAGISSYIMKTEDYNYFYKRYNMEYSKAYTYTGNQHLFSTALLSAGVEKKITKKIAVQLEPSISIPLKGVGDGEVKLFSTSLLLGIKYKPFNK